MTLVVAFEGKDGVLLASDSREALADERGNMVMRSDDQEKIFELTKYCGVGVATGSAGIAKTLIEELKAQLKTNQNIYVDGVIKETEHFARQKYKYWFPLLPLKDRPLLYLILAGYEEGGGASGKIYRLGSNSNFAPELPTELGGGLAIVGSNPQWAFYWAKKLYYKEMALKNLIALGAYLISETAAQTDLIGGPIRISTITREDGFQRLSDEEIAEVLKRNDERNEKLHKFFFAED